MMDGFREESPEVLYTKGDVAVLTLEDAELLKSKASGNERKRMRVCTHASHLDPLHEMLICLGRGSYIQPHRHVGKSESFHMVEGLLSVVLFAHDGKVSQVITLGGYASGYPFYYRLSSSLFHTVVIHSETAVFHEVTNGPFNPVDTEYPTWAPHQDDLHHGQKFLHELNGAIDLT
jgi:cupin fold WbuC family metalloprotein